MSSRITQAVILSAGLGTRFREVRSDIPKVMAPIADTPLLEHTVLLLKAQGITKFIFNLHYLPEKITEYFGDGSRFGVEIVYSDETKELLETGGGLKKMEPLLDEQFLFLYGDQVHRFDFSRAIKQHIDTGALATLVLKRSGVPQEGDCAEIDSASGRIVRWHARPHEIQKFGDRYFLNSGLYVFSKKILDHIPADRPVKLDIEVLPRLVAEGYPIYGFVTDEKILDIGTPERYAAADVWYRKELTKENSGK